MASGEQPNLQKGQKTSHSSSSSRNERDEVQWVLLPNNLELSDRSKLSKKQRNREKLRSFTGGNSSASSPNANENFSSHPVKFQNLQRTNCNTATWLKDQLVNDERTKHRSFDSDEVFSDADVTVIRRENMNLPVSHTFQSSEGSQDNQRPPSRSVVENENTKCVKEECKKNEADSAINFERLSNLLSFISTASQLHQDLGMNDELEVMKRALRDEFNKLREVVNHVSEGAKEQVDADNEAFANGISPSSTLSKASASKEDLLTNDECTGFSCDEEHINKCSHLFEKLKHPDDKLMALKLQETLLSHMQKKAENKLASFRASVNQGTRIMSTSQSMPADELQNQISNRGNEEKLQSLASQWNSEALDQGQQLSENSSLCQIEASHSQTNSIKSDSEDLKQLHMSLEDIRKRVQSMHQIRNNKNMAASLSSDDCDMGDVGERVAAVEWERKKLKNKLIELQEKKKMNEELLKELSYLKGVANKVVAVNNDDSNCISPRVSQAQTKEKKKADIPSISANQKLSKQNSSLHNLEGVMNLVSPQESNSNAGYNAETDETNSRSSQRLSASASIKRDNVQKKQNSGFPARRHYEAEGRANEDADVPVTSPASLPSLDKWSDDPEFQEKIKKLRDAQRHFKVLNDIVSSIEETKKHGRSLTMEHLRFLSKLEENFSNDDASLDGSCDSRDGANMIPDGRVSESTSTNVKEICTDGHKGLLLDIDGHKQTGDQGPSEIDRTYDREKLDKLTSQFQQLLELFPSCERKSDDLVRSSGEGDYAQNRNHPRNSIPVTGQARTSHPWDHALVRQDNLQLTRQNIVSFESQNQNTMGNVHNRDFNSAKKDNINNLSGKMEKLSMQNAIHGHNSGSNMTSNSILCAPNPLYNLDSMSTLSSEMNQSHSFSNEMENKAIIDVLKRNSKKKTYDRNCDNQLYSNSSIDSEPLESFNSALAADTTIAATWGGSSIQDCFDDENEERGESLDEEGAQANKISDKSRNASQLENQYPNSHLYIDPLTNVRKKKLPKPPHNCQPLLHENLHCPSAKIKTNTKKEPSAEAISEIYRGGPNSDCATNVSDQSQQSLHSKYVQQLKSHAEQLRDLCEQKLFGTMSKPNTNVPPIQSCQQNLHFPYTSSQNVPDAAQPYNNQLLLCLSQCYHALYMQQLEIQYLHRCMHQNVEDVLHSTTNNFNLHGAASEDIPFRPWSMSMWPHHIPPPNMYCAEQSSASSSPFIQGPLKPYSVPNNPYSRVSGTRPVRAVIHPASQGSTVSQETLNNQVPPRTRANNFLDNFRSYSRQNLLSASNNKRNETAGSPAAPQIQQVHPLIPNESFNRSPDFSSSYDTNSAELSRPLPNSEYQDFSRSKRYNSSLAIASNANYNSSDIQKKSLPSTINPATVKSAASSNPLTPNVERLSQSAYSNQSSVNLIQLYSTQEDSKVGSFSSIRPTTAIDSSIPEASNVSVNIPSEKSDFLIELFREAQSLQSEGRRQRALKVIRDLASNEKKDAEIPTENKIQNDHSIINRTEGEVNGASIQAAEGSVQLPSSYENSMAWNTQSLSATAIPPMSKNSTPKLISTGAVRKKTRYPNSSMVVNSASNVSVVSYDSPQLESSWENLDINVSAQYRAPPECSTKVVEKVITDLQSIFPYGHLKEEHCSGFWAAVNAYILDSLKSVFPLSHKSVAALQQLLDHFLSRFSGSRFIECESEFLKLLSEFLHEIVNCYISTGRFTSTLYAPSFDEDDSSLETGKMVHILCGKVTEDPDKIRELCIKMPGEETDVFSSKFKTVFSQNAADENSSIDATLHTVSPEGDVERDCVPEVELEHEVEACTEADLAEADQSPGQQGSSASGFSSTTEAWPVDAATFFAKNFVATSSAMILSSEKYENEAPADTSPTSRVAVEGALDQEVCLDDIPTKLCADSDEEHQRIFLSEPTEPEPINEEISETTENDAENKSENELSSIK